MSLTADAGMVLYSKILKFWDVLDLIGMYSRQDISSRTHHSSYKVYIIYICTHRLYKPLLDFES